jgi:hypothetical protein
MIPLIKHALEFNQEEMVANTIFNCHVKGLHSIMLSKSDGRTMRMYIAERNHELYKNSAATWYLGNMTLGFHPHEYALTLVGLLGVVTNWRVELNKYPVGFKANRFHYSSKLRGEEPGFERMGEAHLLTEGLDILRKDDVTHMRPEQLHTVYVDKGQVGAWLILEHGRDEGYDSILYSNQEEIRLEEEMYQRAHNLQQIYNVIYSSGLNHLLL